ncbi:MAG: flagellar biosynthetic protein FliO [Myxococcales bacterium]|nr:flagellar biosynthetic protein FliO [Myxococcota bacterium]MDW8283360.1 flagellar biosynthetic protein FliO [Myxococcales bacterium]
MTPVAVLMAAAGMAALQVVSEQGGLTVRLPVRGDPGVPEVHSSPTEITIEIPDGRLERASTTLLETAEGTMPVREISSGTSRSRKRAFLVLHLRPGAQLPADRVSAQISQGWLTVRVAPSPPPVSPSPPVAPKPSPRVTPPASSTAGTVKPRQPTDLALRALPFLLGLGLLVWLIYRQRTTRHSEVRPSAIHIVATRTLSRSQRLMVVDVDRRRFLLSASDPGGVALLAAIHPATPDSGPGSDALDEVFDDMLSDLSGRTPPKEPTPPSESRIPAGRPVLHLVEDPPQATPATEPAERPAASSASASEASSSDVAGLLALRHHRREAAR